MAVLRSVNSSKEASLLGLPRELRLRIYDFVFALDLKHMAVTDWRQPSTRSIPYLNKDNKLIVPWLNLMLVCTAIAGELHSIMGDSSHYRNKDERTYVLDLETLYGGLILGSCTWRRLPCVPEQVQIMEVYFNASNGFSPWGNGGPHAITSSLYQTLNHFIWCGPRFDSRQILEQPLHLKELKIVVEFRGVNEISAHRRSYDLDEDDLRKTLYALGSIVGQINETGVLRGFVDTIQLSAGDKVLNWRPCESEGPGIPAYWHGYGFDWGMESYRVA